MFIYLKQNECYYKRRAHKNGQFRQKKEFLFLELQKRKKKKERALKKNQSIQQSFPSIYLSPLEVQDSDGIDKYDEEEKHPTKMSSRYCSKEVMFIAQVLFQVKIHWKIATLRYMYRIL